MISVRNLRKSFASRGGGNQFELSVDDFDVPAGCFLTILGSSGCGKSTLLRLIAGLARPDAGSIHIAGSPVFTDSDGVDLDPAERNLGMVFQSHSVWPHLSLIENVAFPLRASRRGARLSRSDVATRVRQALDAVDLAGMESQPVALMSGGQKQRAAIARAIVMRPRLLLLDEPMSSLDADLRRRMRDVLFGVRDQFDLTFVHVTHDQAEALAISDQMAVMKNGRIEQLGTPQEIYERPSSRFVAGFVGIGGYLDEARTHFARPEWVEVSRTDNGQGWRACSVVQADYSGDRWLLTIATTAVPLLAFTRDPQLATPGTNLWFRASRSIQF